MLKFRSRVMRARGLRAFAPCALRRRCGPVLSWARFQEDSIHLLLSSCFDFDFCARSGLLPNLLPRGRCHPSLQANACRVGLVLAGTASKVDGHVPHERQSFRSTAVEPCVLFPSAHAQATSAAAQQMPYSIPAPPALTRRPPRPPPRARAPAPGRTPRPPHPPALALRTRAGSLTEPSQRKRADKSWPLRSIRAQLSQFQLSQPPALSHRATHTQRDHGLPAFISPHVKTDTLLAPSARGARRFCSPTSLMRVYHCDL